MTTGSIVLYLDGSVGNVKFIEVSTVLNVLCILVKLPTLSLPIFFNPL